MEENNKKTGCHRPQDDIPYERRMLYIIKDYRRICEANKEIIEKAKQLEVENKRLQKKNETYKNMVKDLTMKKSPDEGTINKLKGQINAMRKIIEENKQKIMILTRQLEEK